MKYKRKRKRTEFTIILDEQKKKNKKVTTRTPHVIHRLKSRPFHLYCPIRLKHHPNPMPSNRSVHRDFSVSCERSSVDIRPTNRTNRIFDLGHRYLAPDIWMWSHVNYHRAIVPDDYDRRMIPTTYFCSPTKRKFSILHQPARRLDESWANVDRWVWPWWPAPMDVSLMRQPQRHTPYCRLVSIQLIRHPEPM